MSRTDSIYETPDTHTSGSHRHGKESEMICVPMQYAILADSWQRLRALRQPTRQAQVTRLSWVIKPSESVARKSDQVCEACMHATKRSGLALGSSFAWEMCQLFSQKGSAENSFGALTGMAAITTTILQLCNSGDHIIASSAVYGVFLTPSSAFTVRVFLLNLDVVPCWEAVTA